MKTNNRNFVRNCWETLLVAAIIGFLTIFAVKAESNLNFDALNGLFTPTQSERFFQAGRADFKREVEIFNHPELYLRDDLLQIDPELIEQMDRYNSAVDFKLNDGEYELYRDR